jgi:hypothetical protein
LISLTLYFIIGDHGIFCSYADFLRATAWFLSEQWMTMGRDPVTANEWDHTVLERTPLTLIAIRDLIPEILASAHSAGVHLLNALTGDE